MKGLGVGGLGLSVQGLGYTKFLALPLFGILPRNRSLCREVQEEGPDGARSCFLGPWETVGAMVF